MKRVATVGVALAIAAGGTVLTTTSASAAGCLIVGGTNFGSTKSWTTNTSSCTKVGVRQELNPAGSAVVFTSWTYGTNHAERSAGSTTLRGANHTGYLGSAVVHTLST